MHAKYCRPLLTLAILLLASAFGCSRVPTNKRVDVPTISPPASPPQDEQLARIKREESEPAETTSGKEVANAPQPPPSSPLPRERTAPSGLIAETDGGRLRLVNDMRVLELWGSPEQMGRAHGTLLRDDIRRVISDVIDGAGNRERIMAGAPVMERFQHDRHRREMRALATAAGVDYMKVVALQLFGDVERAPLPKDSEAAKAGEGKQLAESSPSELNLLLEREASRWDAPASDSRRRASAPPPGLYACTNFAMFGPATLTGECIAGRNFDFWYQEVARYASLIIHYRHEAPLHSFVTFTWAGVINGWTLMNDAGICTANNLASGPDTSMEAISTCFLLRLVVEEAGSVAEGIEIARRSRRSGGTAMLVAGGSPPDAVELEYDHSKFVVRRAHKGWVIADNGSRVLGHKRPLGPEEEPRGRYGTLLGLIKKNYGKIDRTMNFAGAKGVALEGINLHSAMLFPQDLTFAVSMGVVPANRGPYRRFRMTPTGIESAE